MRSVFWQQNRVRLIDQRQLPDALVVVQYDTAAEVAQAIADMAVRGAPAIGAAAGYAMALAALASTATDPATLVADLRRAKAMLDGARPTAVNLSWATQRLLNRAVALTQDAATDDVTSLQRGLVAEAEALAGEDVLINRRIGSHGAALIADGANLLHHCNTGALATVDFGTALGIVYACKEAGKQVHVWVDETRPRLQGARLTAWELMRADIPMHLIADNAAGHLMRTGQVDAVIFGADRVAANGDVANKIGTYKLAVVARENGIPVYCAVPASTIDLGLPHGDAIPIEERDASEVAEINGVRVAPVGVPVYNPAFDITPQRYISAFVTEAGVCRPPFDESLAQAKAVAEAEMAATADGQDASRPEVAHG